MSREAAPVINAAFAIYGVSVFVSCIIIGGDWFSAIEDNGLSSPENVVLAWVWYLLLP